MIIGQYLEKKGITQRQFAATIGCSTAFVNNLINGKNTDIKISLLRKICKATKLNESKVISALLEFKDDDGGLGVDVGTKSKR